MQLIMSWFIEKWLIPHHDSEESSLRQQKPVSVRLERLMTDGYSKFYDWRDLTIETRLINTSYLFTHYMRTACYQSEAERKWHACRKDNLDKLPLRMSTAKTYRWQIDSKSVTGGDDCFVDTHTHLQNDCSKKESLVDTIRMFTLMQREYQLENNALSRLDPDSMETKDATGRNKMKLNACKGQLLGTTNFKKRGERTKESESQLNNNVKPLEEDKKYEQSNEDAKEYDRNTSHCARSRQMKVRKKRRNKELDGWASFQRSSTTKKHAFVLLVMFGFFSMADSKSLDSTTYIANYDHISSYDLLVTDVCNIKTLNRSQTCHYNEQTLKDTIQHCGFQAKCLDGHKARCVNTVHGGMAHICVPENIKCLPGYRRIAWIDQNNQTNVKVKEEKCPHDWFQPTISMCFGACSKKHLSIKDIPEKYVLYSEGDNIYPTFVYCNNEKGYVNLENKTFLNYDEAMKHEPLFCRHIDDIKPLCAKKENPLPNGTCVPDCLKGYCRDDHDGFICKRNCSFDASNEHDKNKDLPEPEGIHTTKGTVDQNEAHGNTTDMKDTVIQILCSLLFVVACLGSIVTVIVIRLKRIRRSNNDEVDDSRSLTSEPPPSASESLPLSSADSFPSTSEPSPSTAQPLPSSSEPLPSTIEPMPSTSGHLPNASYIAHSSKDPNASNETARIVRKVKNTENTISHHTVFEQSVGPVTIMYFNDSEKSPINNCDNDTDDHSPQKDECSEPLLCNEYDMSHTCDQNRDVKKTGTDENESPMQNGIGIKGEGLKKDIDDTHCESWVDSLHESMKKCGALIYKGNLRGTVFRVGTKYVLTALHVITCILKADNNSSSSLPYRSSTLHDVYITFKESVCDSLEERFKVKVVFTNEDIDVAVLEIKTTDQSHNLQSPVLLWPYNADELGHQSISIIGYGHEKNPYKKFWEKCQPLNAQQIKGKLQSAEAWLQTRKEDFLTDIKENKKDATSLDRFKDGYDCYNIIKFDCFMGKGVSGGPIFANKQDSILVIGIMIGGKPEFYYNLSEQKQKSFPNKHRFEFGVKMSVIYDKMKLANVPLAKDIFQEVDTER